MSHMMENKKFKGAAGNQCAAAGSFFERRAISLAVNWHYPFSRAGELHAG